VRLAPEVFDQSEEDGAVEVLMPEPSAPLWAAVREAATLCPVRAITLTE
jgi:ferredoxin